MKVKALAAVAFTVLVFSPTVSANEKIAYEVWASDQSNSIAGADAPGAGMGGTPDGTGGGVGGGVKLPGGGIAPRNSSSTGSVL